MKAFEAVREVSEALLTRFLIYIYIWVRPKGTWLRSVEEVKLVLVIDLLVF